MRKMHNIMFSSDENRGHGGKEGEEGRADTPGMGRVSATKKPQDLRLWVHPARAWRNEMRR